ncbi:MAG: hypothetical protein WCJ95_05215, partial [Mariniphaga sp.]
MTKSRVQIINLLLFVLTQFLFLSCGTDKAPQLKDGKLREVISRLTLDEKIALTVGVGDGKTPPPGVPVYDPKSGITIEDNTTLNHNALFTPTVDGYVWGIPRLGIKSTVMG